MLRAKREQFAEIDLKVVGSRAMVSCESGDYGRVGLRLKSGAWTDAVVTVYGSIDRGQTIHPTGETLTAAVRVTPVLDVIGWTEIVLEVTTADTGSGGKANGNSMFKGPA